MLLLVISIILALVGIVAENIEVTKSMLILACTMLLTYVLYLQLGGDIVFKVYIATRSGDVYHNENILVDLDKDFKMHDVITLLNGGQVPYSLDDNGIVKEWCFINEENITEIKKHYANFEDRYLVPVLEHKLLYVSKATLSDYYVRFCNESAKELETILKNIYQKIIIYSDCYTCAYCVSNNDIIHHIFSCPNGNTGRMENKQ